MSEGKVCPTCGSEYPVSERFCPRDGTALRSSNPGSDLVGAIVAERYHVMRKLGEGGMGTVYLAEHVKMGRKSALKVMNPGMTQDADAIARFNREAANASRLNHPNICAIYDFGETADGLIYLAMEFIEGQSLTSLVEEVGALPPARAASILHQAADGLQVAHDSGIVHRDLKPDNIMIAKGRDGSDLVKVVDFGIAKAHTSDAQKVTKTGLVVGTPEYMSPEQLAGDKLDGRSDIYSLALVGFNMLTGQLPFPSNSAQEAMIMRLTEEPKRLAEMRPDVAWTPRLQSVMDRALARDAAHRYQSAAEFGRDFSMAINAMPAPTDARTITMSAHDAPTPVSNPALPPTRVSVGADHLPPGMREPAARPVAKRGNGAMYAGAALVVVALGAGAWFMTKDASPDSTVDPVAQTPTNPPPNDTKATVDSTALANAQKTVPDPKQTKAAPPVDSGAAGRSGTVTTPPVTPTGPTTPVITGVSSADSARLDDWTGLNANEQNLRRAVDLATQLLPRARGEQRVHLLTRRGEARIQLDVVPEGCKDLREALATASAESRFRSSIVNTVNAACNLPGH